MSAEAPHPHADALPAEACGPRLVDRITQGVIMSGGLAAAVIAASVCYEVFMRSVLGRSVIWVEEVSAYLIGYIVFVGMGAALYQGAHVEVDFLSKSLKGPAARLLRIVSDLVMLAIACALIKLSWDYWHDALVSGERSVSMLAVPLWIPYSAFLVGSILLLIFQAIRLACVLRFGPADTEPAHDEGSK